MPELSDLVIYCKSVHFGGFSNPSTSEKAFYEMASFSENRALRLLQESGEPLSLQASDPGRLDWSRLGLSSTLAGVPSWHSLLYVWAELARWGGVGWVGGCVFGPPRPSLLT